MAAKMVSKLAKHYTLKQEIGRGGFSVTWEAYARDKKQKQNPPLVIKELLLDRIEDWKSVELFEREAKVLSHLNHPHIPNFIEYIESEEETGKRLFLVQEYIEGQDISSLIQGGKFFTEGEVVEIAESICQVLIYLHGFSPPMIHRDIKPSNIMIRNSDQKVFLIDFGAVKGPSAMDSSKGYTVTGTFGYMPIEQVEGRGVPASDLYALGMSLIFMLSHQDPTQIPKKNLKADFRPFVNISDRLAKIIDRLIEPDLNKRMASATELNAELNKLKNKSSSLPMQLENSTQKYGKTLAISLAVLGVLGFCTLREHKQAPLAIESNEAPVTSSQADNLPIMTAKELLRRANEYYDAAKYTTAIKYYNAYIEKKPDDPTALNRRGFSYGETSQHQAAVNDYEQVLELAPESYTLLHYNLGYNHYKQGHYTTALAHFQTQIKQKPQNVDSINYIGLCHKHLKNYPEAIAAYKQAIGVKPDSKYPYNNLARLYHDTEDYAQAKIWYLKAIENSPDYALPHYNFGELYYDQKDYPNCIAEETLAIEKSNSYTSAYNMRGLCYRKNKELDQAIEDFQVAVTQNPKYDTAFYNLGLTYDDKELFSEAIRSYQKAIEITPDYSLPLNNLAYIYKRKKDYDNALLYYDRAIKSKPDSGLYLRNRGDIYQAKNMCSEALKDWQNACKLGNKSACSLACP